MRTVEFDGQPWRVEWNPQGRLSGAGQGLGRKITISCSPENGPVRHLGIWTDEIAHVDAFMSLDDEQVKNLIRRSQTQTRTWADLSGRTWEVSLYDPSNTPIATPPGWPKGKPAANAENPHIRFTDPANPTRRAAVPYTAGKPLSQLTHEEMANYWTQIAAARPELREPEGPTSRIKGDMITRGPERRSSAARRTVNLAPSVIGKRDRRGGDDRRSGTDRRSDQKER